MSYYNNNSGYIGQSRSLRSQLAIEYDYEMPISQMKRTNINSFLDESDDSSIKKNKSFLKKLPVTLWKNVAKKSPADSWHHTGKMYNETNHYSLESLAKSILSNKKNLDKFTPKKNDNKVKYGVVKCQVWGGTRSRPRVVGEEIHSGVIRGDWLYFNDNGKMGKRKLSANKTISSEQFDSYEKLIKEYKEYKGTKRSFNKILRNLIK